MGILVNASGQYIRSTTNLPAPNAAFTICGWARANILFGTYQNLFGWESGASSAANYINFGWVPAGQMNLTHTASSTNLASGPTVGQWFFWYVKIDTAGNPDTWTAGFRTVSGAWVSTSSTSNETFTAALLILGNNSYDEYGDMTIGPTKALTATLTLAELDNEMWRICRCAPPTSTAFRRFGLPQK